MTPVWAFIPPSGRVLECIAAKTQHNQELGGFLDMMQVSNMNKTSLMIVGIVVFIMVLVILLTKWLHWKKGKRGESIERIDIKIDTFGVGNVIGSAIDSDAQVMIKPLRESNAEIDKKRDAFRRRYRISTAHPKLLSKRYSSRFLIQIYIPEMRHRISRKLKKQFEEQKIAEHIHDSELEIGQEIELKLFSPGIAFSEPVSKKLDKSVIATNFIAKPDDNCYPGNHQVILSISDVKTRFQYQSIGFRVKVTDFAFDHVSRPALSKASSFAMGVGSLTMFVLTLLGKIDSTFGLTSGAVAGMLASGIYGRFISLYHQRKVAETS